MDFKQLIMTTIMALSVGLVFGLLSYFFYFKPEKMPDAGKWAITVGITSAIVTALIGIFTA